MSRHWMTDRGNDDFHFLLMFLSTVHRLHAYMWYLTSMVDGGEWPEMRGKKPCKQRYLKLVWHWADGFWAVTMHFRLFHGHTTHTKQCQRIILVTDPKSVWKMSLWYRQFIMLKVDFVRCSPMCVCARVWMHQTANWPWGGKTRICMATSYEYVVYSHDVYGSDFAPCACICIISRISFPLQIWHEANLFSLCRSFRVWFCFRFFFVFFFFFISYFSLYSGVYGARMSLSGRYYCSSSKCTLTDWMNEGAKSGEIPLYNTEEIYYIYITMAVCAGAWCTRYDDCSAATLSATLEISGELG